MKKLGLALGAGGSRGIAHIGFLKALEDNGERPLRREGYRNGGWVLVDFGCVVIHIFMDEARKFYSLEHLWSDAQDVDISDIITE